MATSISKISTLVTGDSSGLVSAMSQAASATNTLTSAQTRALPAMRSLSGGMGGVSMVAQQATFAIDDFFAAAATGGVAGGLRGATNNLTMIAASLGGVKLQLAAIGALTIGQMLAKNFGDGSSAAQKLRDSTDAAVASMGRWLDMRREAASLESTYSNKRQGLDFSTNRDDLKLTQDSGRDLADRELRKSDELRDIARQKEMALRNKAEAEKFLSGRANIVARNTTHRETDLMAGLYEEAYRTIAASEAQILELRKRRIRGDDELRALREEIKLHEELKTKTEERVKANEQLVFQRALSQNAAEFQGFQPFVTQGMRDATAAAMEETDIAIEALKEKMGRERMDIGAFSRMPSMFAQGGVGAISTISAAQIGPQNLRDSQQKDTASMARDMRRLRELEERKKGLVEVIGL